MADAWFTPNTASGEPWQTPTYACDGSLDTNSWIYVGKIYWSAYLALSLTVPILCTKVRSYQTRSAIQINAMEVDVYYGGAWVNIYSGAPTVGAWVEYAIGSEQLVSAMRLRYYNAHGTQNKIAYVWETALYGHLPAAGRSFGFIIG